ncbi:right-handed parallel beta-helix repeat-containing protein [Kaarinaea lacus]
MLFNRLRCIPAFTILLFVVFFGNAPVRADIVTGTINVDTTWSASGNPWIIRASDINNPINEINVATSATLTIEPGAIVEIDGPIALRVEGTLIARGQPDNPITFRPFSSTGQWRFIEFFNPGFGAVTFSNGIYQSGSILEYVNIESAGGLTYDKAFANGSIYLNQVNAYINHVSIRDGDAVGIYATGISNELKIQNTSIINNHDTSGDKPAAIFVDGIAGSNVEISNCTIQNNTSTTTIESGGVVTIRDIDVLTLSNNTIMDNVTANNGGGVFLFNLVGAQTNYVVQGNTISGNIADNSGGGIAVQNANAIIRNNMIYDNMTTLDFGGGIYIAGDSTVQIDGNAIKNNDAGSDGGGIYVNTALATNISITNNAIFGNNTGGRGSGIFIDKDTITITNNLVADNIADGNIAAMEVNAGGTITQNSVVRNQSDSIIAFGNPNVGTGLLNFTSNNVSQNSSTQYTIINDADILPNISSNNIVNNGTGFYLGNNIVGAPTPLSANNNWFGTTDQNILAFNMDGDVAYDAPATAVFTDPAPISPPTNFTMARSGDSVNLSWNAPPESDLAGFIVYWGNSSAPNYENAVDVGMFLSHTLTGVSSSQNFYFAVTAYDSDYGTVTDDPATLINEVQTSGHESWFSVEQTAPAIVNTGGDGGGGSVTWWGLLLMLFFYGRRRYA